jgi:DNA-binding transcriptional LysR family regulator
MDLHALSDFNLVARHGGFGRASRATGRPKATLSRRVVELETSLGCRLFERGAGTPRLTQEGTALFERTSILLGEIEDIAANVASGTDRPRGRLRVSAPVLFSQVAMGQLAAGFALLHPDVRLEATAEDRSVDLVEEGYDVVIRVNPRAEQDLIGRCFLRDRLVVVAAPALPQPEAGGKTPAILFTSSAADAAWVVRRGHELVTMMPDPILRLSSLLMVRDAVRTGVGAALLPLSLLGRDLHRGRLVSWGEADMPPVELWALHTSRRLPSNRVTAFLSYISSVFPNGAPSELAAFVAHR